MISDVVWLKRMLTHNVRMPMSVIMGYEELLRRDLLNEDEKKEAISAICDNVTYINEVLKVILQDDIEPQEALETVDLVSILQRTTKYINEVARKIPIKINFRAEKEEIFIKAEPVPAMKVFYHLFDNALKYLKGGNTISINVFNADEDNVLVVFKDDGEGVDSKDTINIFKKGYRGKNSIGKAGSGYGLYEVKQIVESYDGSIEVSSSKDRGFTVYLIFKAYKR